MPVSLEILQETTTNVTGCLLRPARCPPNASTAHLAGTALPAACTTPGCAPSPPHAPPAGTCRSSAWGSLWGCGAKRRYRLSPIRDLGALPGLHLWGRGSSPLPDRRRGLGPAVTNVINSPHHSPGLLPAEERAHPPAPRGRGDALPRAREIKLSGPPVAPAWKDLGRVGRGAGSPAFSLVSAKRSVPSLLAVGLLESGLRRGGEPLQPRGLREQSPQNFHLGLVT